MTDVPTKPIWEPSPSSPAIRYPELVDRWNWGAFALTPFWAAFNRVWWLLAVVIVSGGVEVLIDVRGGGLSLPLGIWAGIKGNSWAWDRDRRNDVAAFDRRQRRWSRAGWISIPVAIALVVAYAVIDPFPSPAQAPPPPAAAHAPVPAPAGWRVENDPASGFAFAIPDSWTRIELSKDRFPASFDSFSQLHPASARANKTLLRSFIGPGSFALVEPGALHSAVAIVYGYPYAVVADASRRAAREFRSKMGNNAGSVSVGDTVSVATPAGRGWSVRSATSAGLVDTLTFLQIGDRLVQVHFILLREYEGEHRTVQERIISSIRRPDA